MSWCISTSFFHVHYPQIKVPRHIKICLISFQGRCLLFRPWKCLKPTIFQEFSKWYQQMTAIAKHWQPRKSRCLDLIMSSSIIFVPKWTFYRCKFRGRKSHALLCSRCKHRPDQHQQLSDEIVTDLLAKLTDMLSSSSGKVIYFSKRQKRRLLIWLSVQVVLPAVEAIEKLMKGGKQRSPQLRLSNLEVMRAHSGVQRLLSLVSSRSQPVLFCSLFICN
jgi:hypothetical protein